VDLTHMRPDHAESPRRYIYLTQDFQRGRVPGGLSAV